MLTSRGWWLLLIVLTLLALGVLSGHPALALLALTLLLWFLGQWLLFAIRSHIVIRRAGAHRIVSSGGNPVATLWAGQRFRVDVEVHLHGPLGLPYVAASDWVPFGIVHERGPTRCDGALSEGWPLRLGYEAYCPSAGRVRFEGVRLQLADLQGFFYHAAFVPAGAVCRVLPAPVDAGGHPATTKRHNLLPPPGIHRLRRPGTGSELLDLRDYLPGDPPKTVAWKVSARRDRLITKEFESEVPVRCTLFVDTSHSVRIGPAGHNALARLVEVAAAAAQANAANRDLTGLCLFEEHTVRVVRPARGSRHLAQLVNVLADAATLTPTAGKAPVDDLMQLAYPLAQEVCPELLRPEVNRVPFWLPWLWPLPAEPARRLSTGRRVYRLLFILAAVIGLLGTTVFYYLVIDLFQALLPASFFPSPLLIDLSMLGGVLLAIGLLRVVYRALPLAFSPARRRLARRRKRLAAVLAARYGLGPAGLGMLLEDDEQLALLMQRFLADYQVPYTLPLYDSAGRYLFASAGKVDVLARALVQAVGRGHDNELFVLLADLLELPEQLDPLLRAVRVALARHHQVVVVCPWPVGLPPPEAGPAEAARPARPPGLHGALQRATALRVHAAFQHLRRTFARLRVPVVGAAEEPVRLILDRMDRLRGLGRRR